MLAVNESQKLFLMEFTQFNFTADRSKPLVLEKADVLVRGFTDVVQHHQEECVTGFSVCLNVFRVPKKTFSE